mmetsp:Transcript_4697/g.12805  ORF Transcript_4697/g.12805 Transcript_4697/m.12805 type:complete len:303 (+) Transcript_4697:92-1000(+)
MGLRGFPLLALCAVVAALASGKDADALADLPADDACAGDAGESDALSVLQRSTLQRSALIQSGGVAAETKRAREVREARHDPGLELSSHFFVGSGTSPYVKCATKGVVGSSPAHGNSAPRAVLYSGLGAGGAGVSWQFSSLVIMDGPARDQVNLEERVQLTLGVTAQSALHASFDLSPVTINVEGLREAVQDPLDFKAAGTHECPPGYCLMPKPAGGALPDKIATPACGFEEPSEGSVSVAGPGAGQNLDLQLDVTDLVAANYTMFKVWAEPSALNQRGMWQTPGVTVTSWGFSWALPLSLP